MNLVDVNRNLAKLGDGLAESPTFMVGEKQQDRKLGKNRGILTQLGFRRDK